MGSEKDIFEKAERLSREQPGLTVIVYDPDGRKKDSLTITSYHVTPEEMVRQGFHKKRPPLAYYVNGEQVIPAVNHVPERKEPEV